MSLIFSDPLLRIYLLFPFDSDGLSALQLQLLVQLNSARLKLVIEVFKQNWAKMHYTLLLCSILFTPGCMKTESET